MLFYLKTRYKISEIRNSYSPIISIFGSSTCSDSSKLFSLAEEVGKILGKNGFTTAHGGYTCIMDAVAKGTVENGGKSIGITTDEITAVKPSKYLSEEFCEFSLMSRLEVLLQIPDAYIYLPGSSGTLTELALVWDKQKLGLIPLRPLFLLGKTWHTIFDILFINPDPLVVKSTWKLDLEVKKSTILLENFNEFESAIQHYL